MVTKTCNRCGNDFEVDLPEDLGESWRAFLERLPVLCDTCGTEDEEAEQHREAEEAHRRWLQRVEHSRIPNEWVGARFDDLDRSESEERAEAIDAAERWARGELKGLVLGGPVGVGKTRIAATAASERLRHEGVDWMSVPRLVNRARAGYDTRARAEVSRLLDREHRALVLDDIDKSKPTDFVLDLLFEVIDSRVSNGAPLLVTTNLRGKEFKNRLSEPIYSRLRGYGEAVRITGRDRRTQKAAA